MFYSRCQGCQHCMKLSMEQKGQTIPCPGCGIALLVTATGTQPVEPLPPAKPITRPYKPGKRAKAPAGGGGKKGGRLLLWIGLVMVVLPMLACVTCIGFSFLMGPSQTVVKGPNPPPGKPADDDERVVPNEPGVMPRLDPEEEKQIAEARQQRLQQQQVAEIKLLQTVRTRSITPGQSLVNFRGGFDKIVFSPDSTQIAFNVRPKEEDAFANRTHIRIWDIVADKEKFLLPGHGQEIKEIAFAADGRTLISVGRDKDKSDTEIKHWDLAKGELKKTLRFAKSAWSAAFSADGATLALGMLIDMKSGLRIVDVETGKQRAALPIQQASRLVFSPNGKLLVCEAPNPNDSGNLLITVWETSEWKKVKEWDGLNQLERMTFSPDGWMLLLAGNPRDAKGPDDSALFVWELRENESPRAKAITDLKSAVIAPDNSFVAWTTNKGELVFANPSLDKDTHRFEGKFGHPTFSSGGLLLAIHGLDAGIYSVLDLMSQQKKAKD